MAFENCESIPHLEPVRVKEQCQPQVISGSFFPPDLHEREILTNVSLVLKVKLGGDEQCQTSVEVLLISRNSKRPVRATHGLNLEGLCCPLDSSLHGGHVFIVGLVWRARLGPQSASGGSLGIPASHIAPEVHLKLSIEAFNWRKNMPCNCMDLENIDRNKDDRSFASLTFALKEESSDAEHLMFPFEETNLCEVQVSFIPYALIFLISYSISASLNFF